MQTHRPTSAASNPVRIVADDLTGALDSAAPLTLRAGPLPVHWRSGAWTERGSFALDTESRDGPSADAGWLGAFDGAGLAYKKIDSLLRGNTVNEVAACLSSGLFGSTVIAPAFPAQQRITRGGRQHWRAAIDHPWQAVACDLEGGLAVRGVEVHLAASAEEVRGSGPFLCDATSDEDLSALIEAGQRLAGPVLWCGSAGLARALAGAWDDTPRPRVEAPLLLVVGSHHPVTLAQLQVLSERSSGGVVRIAAHDSLDDAIDRLGRLSDRSSAALVLDVPDGTGATIAGRFFDRALGAVVERLAAPRTMLVSGGATLRRLVGVLDAGSLLVTGELLPGVPRSVLRGGRWNGTAVISKSGAFGDPGLLIRLAESAKDSDHD